MTMSRDVELSQQIESLFVEAGIQVDVAVHDGVAQLSGRVTSPRIHEAALDLARSVDGVRDIDDQMDYEVVSPDMAYEEADVDESYGFADRGALTDDVSDTEPDYTGDVGADAGTYQDAVEEAEPYFPRTDPVVEPSDDEQELDVVTGFHETSMEEVATQADVSPGNEPGETDFYADRDDEDIRADVERELREDAATTNLDVEVEVIDGVVYLRGSVQSLDDSENAEAVAGRVPGVVTIQDMTEVEEYS